MGRARRIVRGVTYKTTRRTIFRVYHFVPGPELNNIFLYCLGAVLAQCSIRIHSIVVMSNHYHLVLTDPDGELSRFKQKLNFLLASSVNALRQRKGTLFEPGSFNAVTLTDDPDFEPSFEDLDDVDEIAFGSDVDTVQGMSYGNLNVVRAGLVPRRYQWPGIVTRFIDIANGKVFRATKPTHYFRSLHSDHYPEEVSFQLSRPPQWDDYTPERVREECARLDRIDDRREREIARQLKREGRRFLGREGVLLQDPNGSPNTDEPLTRQLEPRVAGSGAVFRARVAVLTDFWNRYDRCRRKFQDERNHEVEFPRGTYLLRYQFGCRVTDPDLCTRPKAS